MSGDIKQHVDTNSAEFKQGVEAGLNAGKDMKNWKAGNELGQELKAEVKDEEPVSKSPLKESSIPLFISNSPEGNKGNAQDEKDETEEQLLFLLLSEKFIMHLENYQLRIEQSAMEDFEIGNVVQLRSGGPKMTVHGFAPDGDVICQWFEGNAVHEESFPREALQKVELVKAGGSRREDGVFVVN